MQPPLLASAFTPQNRLKFWLLVLLLCIGATLSVPSNPVSAEEPLNIGPVEVEDQHVQDALEPSALGTTIDVSKRHGRAEQLTDVLRRAAGVVIRSFGSVLQPRQVQIRGAASQQVVVEVDGIRFNSLSHGGFDLALLPLGLFERATVLRGAGTLAHGSGAEGGVVSLQTHQPRGDTASVRASASGGSFMTAQTEVSAGLSSGNLALAGGVSYAHSQGEFDFEDDQGETRTRQNNDGNRVGGFLSGALGRRGSPRLAVTSIATWLERGAPGPSEFPSRFADARTEDWQVATALRGELPGVFESEVAAFDGSASFAYRTGRSAYQNPSALLGGTQFRSVNEEHSISPATEWVLYADTWSTTTLRLQARHEMLTRTNGAGSAAQSEDFNRTVLAASLVQEAYLWDGVLRLFGGARVEGPAGDQPTFIPRAGAVAQMSPWLALHLNLGRAFRLPTFDELYLQQEFVRGDPDLKPETAFQSDIALRIEPAAWVWVEASAFLIDYDDLILFVPTTAFFYQARNLRGATSRGVELNAAAQPLHWLGVELGYGYTEARFEAEPRDPLPGRPEHTARGLMSLLFGPVTTEVEARYVGKRYLDSFGNREESGAVWLDASVVWDVVPEWRLALRGTNLLNVDDQVDALQQPLPGLAVYGAVSWRQDFALQ